jgi:hypothetical protein
VLAVYSEKPKGPFSKTGLCRIWVNNFFKRGVNNEHNSTDFLAMVAIFEGQLWPGFGLLSFLLRSADRPHQ